MSSLPNLISERFHELNRGDKKDLAFLTVTDVIGLLGTCDRASVGAVIVRDGRCISWGYNGAPPGLPHCDENLHGWLGAYPRGAQPNPNPQAEREELGAWQHEMLAQEGCRNSTHAEANALAFAAREGISTAGGTLYVSVSPCEVCSRLLIAAGIKRVVWATEYRDPAGLNLLSEAGVELL